jgi:membrane-bound serine protease (ClpP class)
LSLKFIIPATIITAAFFIFIATAGFRAQRLPVKAGPETMIGRITPAFTAITAESGKVFLEGSYWNAVSETPVAVGEDVEIVQLVGLVLKVKPKEPQT